MCIPEVLWNTGYKTIKKESETDIFFGSYPHCNHKAIEFVKLRVSMWKINRKKLFQFLPFAYGKAELLLNHSKNHHLASIEK